jgi:hypothetical protein
MSTEIPFELLEWQRSKLVEFVHQFDRTYGDSSFNPQDEFSDPALIAMALRSAQLMSLEEVGLEQFFLTAFGLTGLTGGELGTVLAFAKVIGAENLIRCAAGGKN